MSIRSGGDQTQWVPGDVITDYLCDQCNEHRDAVVVCGEPQDWETSTALVCKRCLAKSMADLDHALACIAERVKQGRR